MALAELQKIWYAKLKEQGFEDIECNNVQNTFCFKTDSGFLHRIDPVQYTHQLNYYRLAGQFFHRNAFDTAQHLAVWDLHSQGISIRKIAKRLTMKSCQVFLIVKRYRWEMINQWRHELVTETE